MRPIRAFVLLLVFLTVPARASDLTIFGGFQHPGRITLRAGVQAAAGALTNPGNFGVVGARVGHGSHRILKFEHTLARSLNFIDTKSSATIYNSNVLLEAPLLLAKPYATAGAGLIRTSGSGTSNFGSRFALNYGGGLKMGLFGPVGARIDVRGYSVSKVQSQRLNVFEMSLGLVFSY